MSCPCRAFFEGNVLSNVSTPSLVDASTVFSSPTPSKCRGRSGGNNGTRYDSNDATSAVSFPTLPPIANPSNGSDARYRALITRSSRSTPPWTTAYIACRRTSS
eukprot:23391-Pelagococcus_subviridis.AAC.1